MVTASQKPLIWTSVHLPWWTRFRSPSAPAIVSEITGTVSRTAISHRCRPVSFWRSALYLRLSGWNVSMEVEKSWAEGLNNSLAGKTKAADKELHFSECRYHVTSWNQKPQSFIYLWLHLLLMTSFWCNHDLFLFPFLIGGHNLVLCDSTDLLITWSLI